MTTPLPIDIDVLILGGGVAGLWTLSRVRSAGYSALLADRSALGTGQTVMSQGILHAGIKYALTGQASRASHEVAQMSATWSACLAGTGEIDLSRVRVLSDHQHLWTLPGLISRLSGFGASRVVRSGASQGRGEAFASATRGVDVYRVDELVLDPASLVTELARASGGCVRACAGKVECGTPGVVRVGGVEVRPRAVVLAAGVGNAELISRLSASLPVVPQVRPLHMGVLVGAPEAIFGHCVAGSSTPAITITSSAPRAMWSELAHNERAWWIGGAIAEGDAIARSESEQASAIRREIKRCLPWLDISRANITTRRVDRAEGVTRLEHPLRRPDSCTVASGSSAHFGPGVPIIAAWPTKLVLAPLLAQQVCEQLTAQRVLPGASENGHAARVWPTAGEHERALVAALPWVERTASADPERRGEQ